MELIPANERLSMLENGRMAVEGWNCDPWPVVKLFTANAGCTWLLTELDPEEPNRAFGLCDLGLGYPELGWVDLDELGSACRSKGVLLERDLWFKPRRSLSEYATAARKAQCIVD